MTSNVLKIGQTTFRIESPVDILDGSFDSLRVEKEVPDVNLRFYFLDPGEFTLPPLTEQEFQKAKLHFHDFRGAKSPVFRHPLVRERLHAYYTYPGDQTLFIAYPHKIWVYDYARREADLYYSDPVAGEGQGERFHVSYRPSLIHFYNFFPLFSTLVLHSSGVIRKGKAVLFPGPSGKGKTTVAQRAAPNCVLSDEANILLRQGEDLCVHATPWGLINNPAAHAPLGAIFMLEQAPHFELRPIKFERFLAATWDGQREMIKFLPSEQKSTAFKLFYEACSRVPLYFMHFSKDYIDWDAIDAVLG